MIIHYHQIKIPISFLNPKSLIQPSEILPVELTGTHNSSLTYINNSCKKINLEKLQNFIAI